MGKGLVALKRLFIKIKHYDSLDEKVMLENDYSTIEKELKALEIIRNSGYISIDIMLSQNYITRKEYDLLKEVLLCH